MKSSKAEVAMRRGRLSRIGVLSLGSILTLCFALNSAQVYGAELKSGLDFYQVGGSKEPLAGRDDKHSEWFNKRMEDAKESDVKDLGLLFSRNPKQFVEFSAEALANAADKDFFGMGDSAEFETKVNKMVDNWKEADLPVLKNGKKVSKEVLKKFFTKLFKIKKDHSDWFTKDNVKKPEIMKQIEEALLDDKEFKLADLGVTKEKPKAEEVAPEVAPSQVAALPAPAPTAAPAPTPSDAGSHEVDEAKELRYKALAQAIRGQCAQAAVMAAKLEQEKDAIANEYNQLAQIAARVSKDDASHTKPENDDWRSQLAAMQAKRDKINKDDEKYQPQAQKDNSLGGSESPVASRQQKPSQLGNEVPQMPQQQPQQSPPPMIADNSPVQRPAPQINVDLPDVGNSALLTSDANRFASQIANPEINRLSVARRSTDNRFKLAELQSDAQAQLQTANSKIATLQSEEDRLTRDLSLLKRSPLSPNLQTQRQELVDALDKAEAAKKNIMTDPRVLTAPDEQKGAIAMQIQSQMDKQVQVANETLKKFDADTVDKNALKTARGQQLADALSEVKAARSTLESQRNKLSTENQTLTAMVDEAYENEKNRQQAMLAQMMGANSQPRANAFQNAGGRPMGRPLGGALGANAGANLEQRRPLSGTYRPTATTAAPVTQ